MSAPTAYLMGNKADGNGQAGSDAWTVSRAELERFAATRRRPKARPGYDLTLRPPKSVSVLWALADDERRTRIRRAHAEAVDEVVRYYETRAVFARRGSGNRHLVDSAGIVAAAFDHRTSRAGDPLLHTHVVTANMTCVDGADGTQQWRAIAGAGLYEHARAAGHRYQAHLRHLLATRLGARFTPVVNGHAEIADVHREVIAAFSKRRHEIEEVLDAGAIIAYERYLLEPAQGLLDEIAEYNRADCASLVWLRAWLEERRVDAEAAFGTIPRRSSPDPKDLEVEPSENAELAAALLDALPVNFAYHAASSSDVEVTTDTGTPDVALPQAQPPEVARYLLAHLLEWHRREAKPAWWWFFERRDNYEPQQFVDDKECIGGLELVEELDRVKNSAVYRMRFEAQDHNFSVDSAPINPATGKGAGTIVAIDDDTLDLSRHWNRRGKPLPKALMPDAAWRTTDQRAALAEVARGVLDHGVDGTGPFRAGRDLLLRRRPRLRGEAPDDALRRPGESVLDAAQRVVLALDDSCLAVQGPPGAGKTYTGARMIVALISAGKRVGITATTHNAITNLLDEVVTAARETNVELRAIQKTDEDGTRPNGVRTVSTPAVAETAIVDREVNVAAGTSWLWARSALRESVDVMFVDEAGQMSLADVMAVATAAKSLVLLGDPQQLAQASQGTHPDGAGASALEHLLGEHETIPDDLGLFLDNTWRMHPAVCKFVSEVAYDARLGSVPECSRQSVDDAAGLWFVPVAHDDDATHSDAEAKAVAALYDNLVGTRWTNSEGKTTRLAIEDVIVVAPYNAHVAALRRALPAGARVGTVDKFQGQEGAVAIYSTASSSVDDAPRGLNFLFDLHRLNVAVSRARARARAYIVASPELLRAHCRSPEQLRLANALCRYVEMTTPEGG